MADDNRLKSNEDLKYASKVTIGLVNSPLYENISTLEIDDYFKDHFKLTRRHKLNDRLFVKNSFNQSNCLKILFFKTFFPILKSIKVLIFNSK